jgi:hypothetical protein
MTMGYDSPYGTGDRRAAITTTSSANLFQYSYWPTYGVDGNFQNWELFITNTSVAGHYIRFDFGTAIIITEMKWYQNWYYQNQGIWQIQGSNDGTNWTNIGSSFALGTVTTQTITAPSGNTTAYRYYQLLGVSGHTCDIAAYIYVHEIEFSWAYPEPESDIKKLNGVDYADIGNVNPLAIADVKSVDGVG